MNHFKDGIDFIIVSYYKPEYIHLLIKSIRKYVDYTYLITIVANEKQDSTEYKELIETYENDDDVNVIDGTSQESFADRGGMAGVKWEHVYHDGEIWQFGPGSVNHSKGLTLGMKNTDQKYICFLDNDVVFLDKWTDDILPALKDSFVISHRFDRDKGPYGIIREMFMIFKRKSFESVNLYPDCTYVDGAGNITKHIIDNNKQFLILDNSLHNKSLKEKHVLNLSGGEQAFIGDRPFFYHYGRGSSRSDNMYNKWVTEVTKYLEKK